MPFCAEPKCGRRCKLQYCWECYKLHKEGTKIKPAQTAEGSIFDVLSVDEEEPEVVEKKSVPPKPSPFPEKEQPWPKLKSASSKEKGKQNCKQCGTLTKSEYCWDCNTGATQIAKVVVVSYRTTTTTTTTPPHVKSSMTIIHPKQQNKCVKCGAACLKIHCSDCLGGEKKTSLAVAVIKPKLQNTCVKCGAVCLKTHCSDCRDQGWREHISVAAAEQEREQEQEKPDHKCKTCENMIPEELVHCVQCRIAYKKANRVSSLQTCDKCGHYYQEKDGGCQKGNPPANCQECKKNPVKYGKLYCFDCIRRYHEAVRHCKTCGTETRGGYVYCADCVQKHKASMIADKSALDL